jgi:hypothetical protein
MSLLKAFCAGEIKQATGAALPAPDPDRLAAGAAGTMLTDSESTLSTPTASTERTA